MSNNEDKHFKVISINGFGGVFFPVFILFGVVSGFIISPAWVYMKLWNYIADNLSITHINLYQGLILWIITALCIYAFNRGRMPAEFIVHSAGAHPGLSRAQAANIIKRVKEQNADVFIIDGSADLQENSENSSSRPKE